MERGKQNRCKILVRNSIVRMKDCDENVISGFRREVAENCALLGCYSASGVNFLPTFRDKLPVPSSGSKHSKRMSVAQIFRTGATDGRVWAVESLSSMVTAATCCVMTQNSAVLLCDVYFETDLEKLLEGRG
jgi:hypothetical protein